MSRANEPQKSKGFSLGYLTYSNNIPFIVQTCDGGAHRRRDRVNGGMYITDGVVSMALSTMRPQETLIVHKKRSNGYMNLKETTAKVEAYGFSLDLFYGCPTYLELSPTQKVSTSPGHHIGCIVKRLRRKSHLISMRKK